MSATRRGGELVVSPRLRVPLSELRFSFARSAGPGGQRANKVSTKAILRFDVRRSPSLPAAVRRRLEERLGGRLTGEGELVLSSQRYRDRGRNVADCLEKLRALLAAGARAPRPRTPTRPTRASAERRLAAKRRRTEIKRRRAPPRQEPE